MKKLRLRDQCTNQMCGSTQLGTTKAIVKPDFVSCGLLTPQLTFFPIDKLPLQVCWTGVGQHMISLPVWELPEDREHLRLPSFLRAWHRVGTHRMSVDEYLID